MQAAMRERERLQAIDPLGARRRGERLVNPA
jgi:hypothetical protein